MAYLLDSDVFIQGKNLHYGMDFCPGFWDWLAVSNRAGRTFSIEQVRDELQGHDDELADWAGNLHRGFFLPMDQEALPSLASVSDWAKGQRYSAAAVSTFLQSADFYLVAYAHAHRMVVVTHEKAEASVHRIKIPSVCIGVGVKPMTPFQMLRAERARFVIAA